MDYPILSIAGSPSEMDTSKKTFRVIWLVNFISDLNLLVFSTCLLFDQGSVLSFKTYIFRIIGAEGLYHYNF